MFGWLLRLLRGEDGFGRISTGAAMVIALGGGIGAYYVATQGGAPPGTANLWVDTNGGTCTRQGTPADYVDAAACSSYSSANTAATTGDTIRIKDGSYGSQSLSGTKTLHFIGESLTGVVLNQLTISASNVTVDGFTVSASGHESASISGNNSTITNFHIREITVTGEGDTLSHGEIGPADAEVDNTEDGIHQWTGFPLVGLTVNDVYVHDLTGYDGSGGAIHNDGFQSSGATDLLIENSRFEHTDTSLILIKDGPTNNVIIRNNQFGLVCGDDCSDGGRGNSLLICGSGDNCQVSNCSNISVINNTFFKPGTGFHDAAACTNYVARNNYFVTGIGPCGSGITADYNVFQSSPCGSHTSTCSVTWVDGSFANGIADIVSGNTCVKDKGDPANYAPTDIHGVTRPIGSLPDASANEVG